MGVRKLDCNNIPEILKIRTCLKVDFYCNFACFAPDKKSWAALRPFRFRHGSGIRNMFSLMENLCNQGDYCFGRRKFYHNR